MSSITRTPARSSIATHSAALDLLARAAACAAALRRQRAPFETETAEDAARNRALVAADANAIAWRYGQAWRPEDNFAGWTPERRRQQREMLARNLEAKRRRVPGNA